MQTDSEQVFEVVGVYFTNCYWTHLFKHAETSYKKKQFKSVVEAYKTSIEIYNDAFSKKPSDREKNNRCYW